MTTDITTDMPLDWSQTLGWSPNRLQVRQFEHFYQRLVAVNRSINLTRITDYAGFFEKHLWDSLAGIQPWLGSSQPIFSTVQTVIDIGTGGGFPGIPAAIAHPDWQVSLLDSTQKKIQALDGILEKLALSNVETLCNRAERLGRQTTYRGHFDLALVRAVAAASACAEYAIPLVREQGIIVLYRGLWEESEAFSLQQALAKLGGKVIQTTSFQTPLSNSDRHCIYIQKVAPTPDRYPRRIGVPVKNPLG